MNLPRLTNILIICWESRKGVSNQDHKAPFIQKFGFYPSPQNKGFIDYLVSSIIVHDHILAVIYPFHLIDAGISYVLVRSWSSLILSSDRPLVWWLLTPLNMSCCFSCLHASCHFLALNISLLAWYLLMPMPLSSAYYWNHFFTSRVSSIVDFFSK